jgi:hypothetical protein
MRPKDIAPHIFDISKRKRCTVPKALEDNLGVSQINNNNGLSLEQIVQFSNLWEMLNGEHLEPDMADSITWKVTKDGCYSSKSAYSMQFLGHTKSSCLHWFGSRG